MISERLFARRCGCLAGLLDRDDLSFDHGEGRVGQDLQDGEVPFVERDAHGLRVEVVAEERPSGCFPTARWRTSRPRRSARLVDDVVVDERRGVDELDDCGDTGCRRRLPRIQGAWPKGGRSAGRSSLALPPLREVIADLQKSLVHRWSRERRMEARFRPRRACPQSGRYERRRAATFARTRGRIVFIADDPNLSRNVPVRRSAAGHREKRVLSGN